MQYPKLLVIAVAALAVLAAAPTASAEDATLCYAHEEPCDGAENPVESVHLVDEGQWEVQTNLASVLCLSVLAVLTTTMEANGEMELPPGDFQATGCGTNGSHNNCSLKIEGDAIFTLLKTALNLGTIVGQSGTFRLTCTILVTVDCKYDISGLTFDAEGALHTEASGNGMVTVTELPLELESGSFCPEEAALNSLLEPSEEVSIAQAAGIALCKKHTDPKCADADLVTSLEFNLTEDTKFLLTLAGKAQTVTCKKSTMKLTLLGLAKQFQTAHFAGGGLSWSECTLEGEACKDPEVQQLGSMTIEWTNLNLGRVRSVDTEVLFRCGAEDKKLNCVLRTNRTRFNAEGSKDSAKAGNGRIFGSFATLSIDNGTECPTAASVDASYGATSEFFVLH